MAGKALLILYLLTVIAFGFLIEAADETLSYLLWVVVGGAAIFVAGWVVFLTAKTLWEAVSILFSPFVRFSQQRSRGRSVSRP